MAQQPKHLIRPEKPVYVLRTTAADGASHNGFRWPESGPVECPDWKPTRECGNGLHGLLWGSGDGSLVNWSDDAKWYVLEVSEYVDLDGKVKFPRCTVLFCGTRAGATARIVELGADPAKVVGGTATAGNYGTATAGYRGTATAGNRGTATAGNGGTATAGDYGTATAGDYGTAIAGYGGTATAGDGGTATAGDYGTATAGDGGTATGGENTALVLKWWDYDADLYRLAVAYVGEDGIKPHTPYRYDSEAKRFVPVEACADAA